MIDDLPAYPEYKPPGVEWLGDVPAHWEVLPLKRWVKINHAVLPDSTPPSYEFQYLDIGSVGTGVLTARPQRLRFAAAPSRARRVVGDGDTIVSTVRTYLKAVYFVDRDSEELICSTGFAVLTPRTGTEPKFISYLCQSSAFTDRVTADSVGIAYPAIAENRLGAFQFAIPPLQEQSAIVRFLEHADARIRRAVSAKRRLIALLNEEKQDVIHRAVTRGLDLGVPLKPSGVEWLGDVPAHWDIRRLKWALRLQRGYDLPQEKRLPGPYPVVSSGGIIDTHHEYRTEGPGVVMGRYGSTEAVFFITENFWPHNTSLFVTDFQGNLPQWGYYLLRAISKGDYSGKSAVPGINRKDLFEISVPVPPIKDQMRIVPFLIAAEDQNHLRIVAAQKEIDLLLEFRTRLIADVVTGKFDVRAAAAALPDEADEPAILDDVDAPADAEADVPLEIGVEDADGIEA